MKPERHWKPLTMEIVIGLYTRTPHPYEKTPSYLKTIEFLREIGVVAELPHSGTGKAHLTHKGDVLVEMWMQTPAPQAMLADPRTSLVVHAGDWYGPA